MLSADENILNAVLASLSEEDLLRMLEMKRKEKEKLKPREMTAEEKFRHEFRNWFKARMYPP